MTDCKVENYKLELLGCILFNDTKVDKCGAYMYSGLIL